MFHLGGIESPQPIDFGLREAPPKRCLLWSFREICPEGSPDLPQAGLQELVRGAVDIWTLRQKAAQLFQGGTAFLWIVSKVFVYQE